MKKVLITGGCRGIGRAITELFYKSGYPTYACYSSSEAAANEMKEKMPGLTVMHADVSSSAEVKELFCKTGGIDILINNAGVGSHRLFTDITDDEFDRTMKVNLYGTFYCCRECLPHMLRRQSGAIVNISSMWGMCGASTEVHYSASKAGVIGLTKALAKEVAPSGIRVNCVAPGYVDTDINASLSDEEKQAFFEETPMLRGGTVQEIAESVFFLATEKASFITGQVLSPNGGAVI